MATVNLPSYIDDPNYRYKMPKVRCKVEGSGNGIKTNCINAKEIATALKRNPEYLTKWFGCELCVQAKYHNDEGKSILQGVHTEDVLMKAVDRFIEKYVLCPKCHLPEIDMMVTGKKSIGCKCNACGHVDSLDSTHRVAAFIFKNPPDGNATVKRTDTSKKVKSAVKGEKKKVKTKKPKDGDEADREKRKVKVKKVKQFKVPSSGADLTVLQLASGSFEDFEAGTRIEVTKFSQEVRAIQIALGLNSADKVYVALGAFIVDRSFLKGYIDQENDEDEESQEKQSQITKADLPRDFGDQYRDYIADLCSSTAVERCDILKGMQAAVMRYCTVESLKAVYPLLMKWFWDETILSSSDILEFYSEDSEAKDTFGFDEVKKALQPFLDWLGDPDFESYESESEVEDD